ncbi:MAG: hypothetical protein ABJP70_04695 [Erythrobacter sp.]
MIVRVLWFAAILSIGAVTFFVQLDRQARVAPTFAASVPEPYRAFAQTHMAASALQGDDPELALEQAEKLVKRRPIPATHLRILAAAQFNARETQAAGKTVQIAAKRGWRDTLSQEAVLRLALQADDKAEAARRYAALFLNNQTSEELLVELGQPVFAQAEGVGRRAFTDVVAGGERWIGFFLARGPRVLAPDAFVEIAEASHKRGASYPCAPLKRAIKEVGRRDQAAADRLSALAGKTC